MFTRFLLYGFLGLHDRLVALTPYIVAVFHL